MAALSYVERVDGLPHRTQKLRFLRSRCFKGTRTRCYSSVALKTILCVLYLKAKPQIISVQWYAMPSHKLICMVNVGPDAGSYCAAEHDRRSHGGAVVILHNGKCLAFHLER
ncbi:hypothetical protein TRVL_08927 [Trypanosoma vivax]|nr:hypothetical protein TRVL_08927 [Trypanosoma vivax]